MFCVGLLKDDAPAPAKVAQLIKHDLKAFMKLVPLLHVLCNPGMRPRHWTLIADVTEIEIAPDDKRSLRHLQEFDQITRHTDKILEVGETASKQFAIEKSVAEMKADWANIVLATKPHAGSYIMLGDSVEEIQSLTDDHVMKTQAMKGSSYAKPFEAAIAQWESWLLNTQKLMEVWQKVQSAWMYLEPVFGAEDIMKQMPGEGHMFTVVDQHWQKLMREVVANPNMLVVSVIPGVLSTVQDALKLLDLIQQGLAKYLQTKRLYFPRFFFLSDDDLLAILSETKDPLRVQPHLKKCFEGVEKLDFDNNMDIRAMLSKEGEKVKMSRVINPAEAKGAVEKWLKEFEGVMKETIQEQLVKGTESYPRALRHDWVLNWPGQVVLAVTQIFWTKNVASALPKGQDRVQAVLEDCNAALQRIVLMVRGSLTKNARKTLGALVVLDVHARDVLSELIEQKVSDANAFEWLAQMRYYLEERLVQVRMITSTIEYGNEYLGNSNRLVVTPLTDRCYRTLMCALQLGFGGAPEGPAGTGKTETTKDLSKAVGIQCVVFNCSDGLDFTAMAKFFKGLAASGAWSCFDEFNRIDLEVLSVIAQQIQCIQNAKEAKVIIIDF